MGSIPTNLTANPVISLKKLFYPNKKTQHKWLGHFTLKMIIVDSRFPCVEVLYPGYRGSLVTAENLDTTGSLQWHTARELST
jgi:hypothetical protein